MREEEVGQGGFGRVYRCRVRGQPWRPLVIKMIAVDLERDVNLLQGLYQQAPWRSGRM